MDAVSVVLVWLVVVSSLCVAWPALAHAKKHLYITEVFVDDSHTSTSITIMGQDFDFGPWPLRVWLGDFGELTITGTPTNTMIQALLPPDIEPGDYLLIVARGKGESQYAGYGLTLGAVGPQGLQGEPGLQGEQGPAGPQGPPGPARTSGACRTGWATGTSGREG